MTIKYLAWMDYESTGLDLQYDEIVEGAVVITDLENEVLTVSFDGYDRPAIQHAIITPTVAGMGRIYAQPIVLNMHIDSGLLASLEGKDGTSPTLASEFFAGVERMFCMIGEPGEFRIAGSGVARFDRHMVQRYWPEAFDWMHYREHDISPVSTWLDDIGLAWMLTRGTPPSDHRAMSDVLRSIEEDNILRDWFIAAATTVRPREPQPQESEEE